MASFQSGSAYHADSDADDEFERSVVTSPINLRSDSSDTGSEPRSSEHTPTTFNTPFEDGTRPRNIISEWSPEECAHFIASLGLMQYGKDFIGMRTLRYNNSMANLPRTWYRWRCFDSAQARRIEGNGNHKRGPQIKDIERCLRHQNTTGSASLA